MKYNILKIFLFVGVMIELLLCLSSNSNNDVMEETVPAISYLNTEIDNYKKTVSEVCTDIRDNGLVLSSFNIKDDNYYIDIEVSGNKDNILMQMDRVDKLKDYNIEKYDFKVNNVEIKGIVTLKY